MKKAVLILLFAAFAASGCMTYDPYTGEQQTSKATSGAIIGAVGGAAVGALANHGDRGKGALIGAAAGGAAGGGIGYYMDRQEAELRRKLAGTGVRVERNGDQINLVMPGDVTFDVNQASIRNEFVDVLGSVALVLEEFEKTAIRIEGHTDSTGSDSHNQQLSERRATAVRDILLRQGIQISRTSIEGYGESQPIASNDTPAGRQANRRVTLNLIPLQ
jgi:outer membrane protein OmpA-like peptidoglycan-associated protein